MRDHIRVESWCGYDIRFVEVNGEWYAILKDICDALRLRTDSVSLRIDPAYMEKVRIEVCDHNLTGVTSRARKTYDMIAISEEGVYQALFSSRRLEARKFQMWAFDVLKKLRRNVGLEQYEVMRMTEPDIQDEIDYLLDSIYYDEETGILMESVTVEGGDVIQVPFGEDD